MALFLVVTEDLLFFFFFLRFILFWLPWVLDDVQASLVEVSGLLTAVASHCGARAQGAQASVVASCELGG